MEINQLLSAWHRLQTLPGGNYLFNKLLGKIVPYTGSIPFRIISLDKGKTVVELKDSRKVRNHLNSIHAMALANLSELCSGLAINTALCDSHRCILVEFKIKYIKKARGTLTATSQFDSSKITSSESSTEVVIVDVKNSNDEIVCNAKASWKASPIK